MKKLTTILAAVTTLVTAGMFTGDARAMTSGTPMGLRPAIDDIAVTDKVHCRWGWLHHRWRWGEPTWDGCYRSYYGGWVAPYPYFYVGPRFHRRVHIHGPRVHHFRSGHIRSFRRGRR